MPAVGCHAKPRQRMMEIKGTARIRGGEGERGEPHVLRRRRLQNLPANPNFSKNTGLPFSP